jgi:hypothetical protein
MTEVKGAGDEVRSRVVAGCAGIDYRSLVRGESDGMRAVNMFVAVPRLITVGSFMVTMTLVAAALAAVISQ